MGSAFYDPEFDDFRKGTLLYFVDYDASTESDARAPVIHTFEVVEANNDYVMVRSAAHPIPNSRDRKWCEAHRSVEAALEVHKEQLRRNRDNVVTQLHYYDASLFQAENMPPVIIPVPSASVTIAEPAQIEYRPTPTQVKVALAGAGVGEGLMPNRRTIQRVIAEASRAGLTEATIAGVLVTWTPPVSRQVADTPEQSS